MGNNNILNNNTLLAKYLSISSISYNTVSVY